MKFKFKRELEANLVLELPFTEHVEELRQRCLHVLILVLITSLVAFIDVKDIVQILETPVTNIKFFQLAPGEYFISTVKIAFYTGLLITSPFLLTQLTVYIIPGLNKGEKNLILPLLLGSTLLFFFSLFFFIILF
jgi:sec-independent protein translocase protein TatC